MENLFLNRQPAYFILNKSISKDDVEMTFQTTLNNTIKVGIYLCTHRTINNTVYTDTMLNLFQYLAFAGESF